MLKYMSVPDDEGNVETSSIVVWRHQNFNLRSCLSYIMHG